MPRLIPDPSGELVPPGRMKRVLEADFLDGAVPGTANTRGFWTTNPAGTFGLPSLATGVDCTIQTGAVSGNTAEIWGKPVESRFMRAVLWTVEGLSTDTVSNVDIEISVGGSNVGVTFFHLTASTDPVFRKLKSGGNIDISVPWAKLRSSTNKKNLSLLVMGRQYGEAYLMQDDQVIAYHDSDPTWGNATGNVTPKLILTTRQAVAHTVHFTTVRQTIWSD